VSFANAGADERRSYNGTVGKAAYVAMILAGGVCLGLAIGFALGFTHGAPTADNASPPPEAFDYPFGILIGLGIASIGGAIGWPYWKRRRTDS
jgi:cytochrome bd-type quinol oxidase subunit 2